MKDKTLTICYRCNKGYEYGDMFYIDGDWVCEYCMGSPLCISCGHPLIFSLQVLETNIPYLVITSEKLYDNDDRPVVICHNRKCTRYGVLVINPKLLNRNNERKR